MFSILKNEAELIMINTKYQPSFKSKVIIDVGGSVKENSCKINILSNDGKDSYIKDKTVVNTQGKSFYENNEDFLQKIAVRIKEAFEKIDWSSLKHEEKKIKEVLLFMPGNVYDGELIYADNIRGKNSYGLESVNFKTIPEHLKELGLPTDKKTEIKLLQDTLGGGMSVAKMLYAKGLLEEGSHYTVAVTGGGCGIVNIKRFSGEKAILDVSGSSYFTNENGILKISGAGASASAFIRNFCKSMQIDKRLVEEIATCGYCPMVMSSEFELGDDAKGKTLKNVLLNKTNMYEIGENGCIKVKDEYLNKRKYAMNVAIDKYADALARFAVIKENECANGLIITGALGLAIDRACRQNGTSLSGIIENKINETYNTYEIEKIKDRHNFRVICNSDFALNDNTEAKDIALNARFVGKNRYNWVEIDLK